MASTSSDNFDMDSSDDAPENKFYNTQPKLDDETLSRNVLGNEETDIEFEPSEVDDILQKCCEIENQIELLSEVYHLVYGGPRSMLHSSPLTEIKTPMKNTVLHIASWYGKDDIVDLVVEHAPKLLFSFNKNDDSALHVAARAGHITTVKKLLAAYANHQKHEIAKAWLEYNEKSYSVEKYDETMNMEDLLGIVKMENVQGNTVLHEAMILINGKKKIGDTILKAFESYNTEDRFGYSLSKSCYEYALEIVNKAKQSVLYLAVEAGDKEAVKLILDKCPENILKPVGLSPVVAAIMKRDQDMLSDILQRKKNWIHLRDKHGRLPLHYAASTGFHEGVSVLLGICKCCTIQRDKYGYFPLHLASHRGHVEVVKKLLEYCPDPTEMLDDSHERNILHIAAKSGKHEVVRHILETYKFHDLINQKDNKGDTPLHLAARSCHPKTVYYLTWDKRVELGLVNQNNETALDIVSALYQLDSSSMRQQLTWTALKSAGAKQSSSRVVHHVESGPSDQKPMPKTEQKNETEPNKDGVVHVESKPSDSKLNEKAQKREQSNEKVSKNEQYKDRLDTLTVVSTLIITASVAACLAVPGEADGAAKNLNHAMFHFFILCITISLFSSISATIILFWARLGLTELVTCSLRIVMPLLGVALISLSLAFMAGVYTVISKLNWLANIFVVMTLFFVVMVFLLYILLFLPSSSTKKPLRYISYYPFLFLASLTEPKNNKGINF